MIQQAGPVCREWLGKEHECNKLAVARVWIPDGPRRTMVVYKCERHARRFRGDPRFTIEELARVP